MVFSVCVCVCVCVESYSPFPIPLLFQGHLAGGILVVITRGGG
jgi:hypothetical protein